MFEWFAQKQKQNANKTYLSNFVTHGQGTILETKEQMHYVVHSRKTHHYVNLKLEVFLMFQGAQICFIKKCDH